MESVKLESEGRSKNRFLWIPAALGASVLSLWFFPAIFIAPALWAYSAIQARKAWPLVVLSLALFVAFFLLLGDFGTALLFVLLIAPAGVLLYVLERFQFEFFYCAFYTSIALLLALFLNLCLPSMLAGESPEALLVAEFKTAVASVGLYSDEVINDLTFIFEQIYLSALYIVAAVIALVNLLLLHLFDRKREPRLVRRLSKFGSWTLPQSFIFGLLALSLIGAVLSLAGSDYSLSFWLLFLMLWMLPSALAGLSFSYLFCLGQTQVFAVVCLVGALLIPYSLFGYAILGTVMTFMLKRKDKSNPTGGDSN
ncbi:MAG: DUF2232 domain-containing protein [Clostridia bacterium]|nr:DUF2232 domain-containing protein [Clostridia bacterium]